MVWVAQGLLNACQCVTLTIIPRDRAQYHLCVHDEAECQFCFKIWGYSETSLNNNNKTVIQLKLELACIAVISVSFWAKREGLVTEKEWKHLLLSEHILPNAVHQRT